MALESIRTRPGLSEEGREWLIDNKYSMRLSENLTVSCYTRIWRLREHVVAVTVFPNSTASISLGKSTKDQEFIGRRVSVTKSWGQKESTWLKALTRYGFAAARLTAALMSAKDVSALYLTNWGLVSPVIEISARTRVSADDVRRSNRLSVEEDEAPRKVNMFKDLLLVTSGDDAYVKVSEDVTPVNARKAVRAAQAMLRSARRLKK